MGHQARQHPLYGLHCSLNGVLYSPTAHIFPVKPFSVYTTQNWPLALSITGALLEFTFTSASAC